MDNDHKLSHKVKKRIKEVKRKARPGEEMKIYHVKTICESLPILLIVSAKLLLVVVIYAFV